MSCEGCASGLAKILLIIVNIIFLLAGLLMLGLGIALVASPEKVLSFFESDQFKLTDFVDQFSNYPISIIKGVGIFMIVMGGIVAVVALLGFIGACCEQSCLLVTYAIILIIVVLAEVALIIFAARYPYLLNRGEEQGLIGSLTQKFDHDVIANSSGWFGNYSSLTPFGASMSVIQNKYKCCGVHNYTDYLQFNWIAAQCGGNQCIPGKNLVPSSCCVLKNATTSLPQSLDDYVSSSECMTAVNSTYTNTAGCVDAINDIATKFVQQYSKIAIGIAAGIVGLELILITLAFILFCAGRGSGRFAV